MLLAVVMMFSIASFTTVSANEPNYTPGGMGFIGSHGNIDEFTLNLPQTWMRQVMAQVDIYVDPQEWDTMTSFWLEINYTPFVNAIESNTAVQGGDDGLFAPQTGTRVAPGRMIFPVNARRPGNDIHHIVAEGGNGFNGTILPSFTVTNPAAFREHLRTAQNNVIEIQMRFVHGEDLPGRFDARAIMRGGCYTDTSSPDNSHTHVNLDTVFPGSTDGSDFVNFQPITIGMNKTVTFDADGGTPAPDAQTVLYGGTATRPAVDPDKPGYDFVDWFIPNAETPFDFNTVITGNTTIEARFTRSEVTLTYNLNGGTSDPVLAAEPHNVGDTATITTVIPTRANSVFIGWTEATNAPDPVLTRTQRDAITFVTGTILMDQSRTLYAVWAADTQSAYPGPGPGPYNPDQPDGTPDFDQARITYSAGSNVTATGTAPGDVVFNLDPNTGTVEITLADNAGTLAVNQAAFLGWSLTEPAGILTTEAAANAAGIVPTVTVGEGTHTVFAVWGQSTRLPDEPDWNVAEVTFDVSCADPNSPAPDSVYVVVGDTVSQPSEIPTRDGYVFDGWGVYNDQNERVPFDFDTPITEDITLVPIWGEENITIGTPGRPGSDGYAIDGFSIIQGAWANDTSAPITFLVRVNNSADEAVIASRINRFAITATLSHGFENARHEVGGALFAATDVLEFGSLALTTANIGGVVTVDNVDYREITINITNTLRSGIVDFTLTYSSAEGSEVIGSAIQRVLVPGDVNKDGRVNSGDHTNIFNMMRGYVNVPAPLEAGAYVFELADMNVDGRINVGDHTILFNLMRGYTTIAR